MKLKNLLMVICFLIPTLSISQVVFNSNGYSSSDEKDNFPDILHRADTRFVLGKNSIKRGSYEYKIKRVLKEKSFFSNSIIVEVVLISDIILTAEQKKRLDDIKKFDAEQGNFNITFDYYVIDPLLKIEEFEVGYDLSDNVKYIIAQSITNEDSFYTKYVIGSNFYKEPATPSVKW